jgi:starch-binding outer membrane protein, SusD/RagB family
MNKMRKNKLVIGSFLMLSLFASCNKVIDVKETDFIGGDVALKTVANVESGIIGAYATMNVEMGILLNSVFADEVRVAEFYNAATVHEWQYGSTDISIRDNFTAFPMYYRTIDRVNRVLAALPNAKAADATEEALKSRIRGEALFLRAFCHFGLYQFYSNTSDGSALALAYMETPDLLPQARITVAPYMAKLNADLVAAKALVPATNADIARASRQAVTGLQARVALYMKDYPNAATFATEYIAALPLATRTNFPLIWKDANNSEVAFKLTRTTTAGGRIGALYRGTSANATTIGTITWRPTQALLDSYDQVNDIRYSTYFFEEPLLKASTARSIAAVMINKYAGTAYATPTELIADGKVFRTAEMYLIRAEARAETNDLTGAAADLNTLRAARINNYTNASFSSKGDLITAIMNERFKELAFEGHRFFDAKRRNLPIIRLAVDAQNNKTTLESGNFRFLLPIPNSEIQANPLMVQNPGYTN